MVFSELARALAERQIDAIAAWLDADKEHGESVGDSSLGEALTAVVAWLRGEHSRSLHDIARMPPFGDGESARPNGVVSLIAFRTGMDSLFEHGAIQRSELSDFVAQLGKAISDALNSNEVRLLELSSTDALTGAMSRRAVLANLDSEIARSTRHIRPLSVVYIDVDGLKHLNDVEGHAAGDRLLKDVVKAIRSNIRSSDSLGRIGGDEFLLVLPDTPVDGAEIVAEKIVTITKAAEYPVSAGVAGAPRHKLESESLIAAADKALRQARNASREAS